MNKKQKQIKKFCIDRKWGQFHNPKDILLGIVEEVGELRNLIKWEQDPQVIRKTLLENKEELEDGIGDIFWFLSLLANSYDIDIDGAAQIVIERNEKRFPLDRTKNKHTNVHIGGYDGRHQVKQKKRLKKE